MRSLLCLLILAGTAVSGAEVLNSAPFIELPGPESYSCRILRHRVKDRIKGHAGLHALLEEIESPDRWSVKRAKRFESQLGRAGYFPKYYFEPGVKVSAQWVLPVEWTEVMNAAAPVAASWSFKGFEWRDESGILPDDVRGEWLAGESALRITTWITPVQLCFGPKELSLTVGQAGKILELRSFVEWL